MLRLVNVFKENVSSLCNDIFFLKFSVSAFRDRITDDDCIGTCFIHMSNISGQGEEGWFACCRRFLATMLGNVSYIDAIINTVS